MKNTFTRLLFLLLLVFTFSCAQKEVYRLSDGGTTTNTYVKKQNKPLPPAANPLPNRVLPATSAPMPEPIVYTASSESNNLLLAPVISGKALARELLTQQPTIPSVTRLVKQQVKIIKAEKASLKKQSRAADTGKPRNKLAMVGFYLGLGAVLALLIASVAGGGTIIGLLSLFAAIGGFVTSKMGLSEINRNPDMYSGKGHALAGLIISIAVLVLFLIGVIALIAIINSFQ